MKITRFKDIPQFTREGSYQVDMDIRRMPEWIKNEQREMNLQLNPVFQRGHVWTDEQQIAWLEFFLKGGKSGNIVYFNCPSWHHSVKNGDYDEYVCVDGLQRITSICRFINNEIKVFGSYYNEYEDPRIVSRHTLKFNINDLKTERVGDKAVITYAEIKNKTRNQKIAESGDEFCAVFLQTKTNKDVGYFETIIVSGSFAGVDSLALDLSDIMESTFLFNSLDNKLDIITIDNKKISYEYV